MPEKNICPLGAPEDLLLFYTLDGHFDKNPTTPEICTPASEILLTGLVAHVPVINTSAEDQV
jgi:hypothetical protein